MITATELKLKRYLGDGIYAGFDGYYIWVCADRDGQTHCVAFEKETLASLSAYTSDLIAVICDATANDLERLNREQI
jgi:hypothetical protein